LSFVFLGTVIALFGTAIPACTCLGGHSCGCSSAPNHVISIAGLVVTIVFTYVFVFLSTGLYKAEPILESAVENVEIS